PWSAITLKGDYTLQGSFEIKKWLTLQFTQSFCQYPQRPIQTNILINTLYRPSPLAPTTCCITLKPSVNKIFLRAIKHRPQIRATIFRSARTNYLLFGNRCRLFRIIVLQCQRGASKDFGFAIVQRHCAHCFTRLVYTFKAVQHFIRALDDLPCDVTLVRHTYIQQFVTTHQPVVTDKPKHARQHLVTTGA